MRNFKAVGFALLALAAFGAVVAQVASAVPLTVSSVPSKVFITGTSEGVFKINVGNAVECKQAIARASVFPVSGAISEITLNPEFKECTLSGFAAGDIKAAGCAYTLTTPTGIKAGEVTIHSSQFHVLCPAGGKMEFTPTGFGVSLCTQYIREQTPTEGHIVARNVPGSSPMTVTFEITIKGTHWTGTGGTCGTSGTTGELVASTTGKCFSDELHTVQIDCTFS